MVHSWEAQPSNIDVQVLSHKVDHWGSCQVGCCRKPQGPGIATGIEHPTCQSNCTHLLDNMDGGHSSIVFLLVMVAFEIKHVGGAVDLRTDTSGVVVSPNTVDGSLVG